MQKHPTHKSTSGFTLIELLIVIAVIGILAAIAIPQFNLYKIRGYDAHSKQALKDMHLLCNAYWLDTDALQGCDLPKIKEVTYGFNQNADVVATLPPSPLNNFCASAKHNSSPNTYSIDSASMVSEGDNCSEVCDPPWHNSTLVGGQCVYGLCWCGGTRRQQIQSGCFGMCKACPQSVAVSWTPKSWEPENDPPIGTTCLNEEGMVEANWEGVEYDARSEYRDKYKGWPPVRKE